MKAAQKIIKENTNKNVFFNIVGSIDELNISSVDKKLIAKFKNNKKINFLGYKENIDNFINNSDCIVLPSYREGLPRVILEALLLERPVIATDVPGCNRIIKNDFNGILCKAKNVNSLVEAMSKFINFSLKKRQRLGINGRKLVDKEFNEKKVISKYLQVIHNEK